MNAGNAKKKWYKYCLDSDILDRGEMSELRLTKDNKYVIVVYATDGKIEETWSENIMLREDLLRMWQDWKTEWYGK